VACPLSVVCGSPGQSETGAPNDSGWIVDLPVSACASASASASASAGTSAAASAAAGASAGGDAEVQLVLHVFKCANGV
jgi:hypothetical protein